jgi:hypothetical protein
LTVEFVIAQPARNITARVTGWSPEADGDTDGDLIQHRFYAFGFPAGSEGKWAKRLLLAQIASGWVQLQDDSVPGTRIQGGFSGTQAHDEEPPGARENRLRRIVAG